MVTVLLPGLGITPAVVLRKKTTARPIPWRHSGPSSPGNGAVAPCPSLLHDRAMDLSHLPQLLLERFQQAVRQQRVPVLVAFAGTQGHQPLLAIAGCHSQPESLPGP
jgi:hypothetical protein